MKRSYYLFNPGILERKDNTLKFTTLSSDLSETTSQSRYIPIEDVAELYAFGSLVTNSSLFNFLGQKGIPVYFFDYYNNYTGSYMPRDELLSGKALLAQASAYQNKRKRVELAMKFIQGASWNMIMKLNYYKRRGKDLQDIINEIKKLSESLIGVIDIDEIMGVEGNIRQTYYLAFDSIIDEYVMEGRTKRPPQN